MNTRNGRSRGTIPRLPVDSGEFDGFVRDLLDRMQKMALAARPTMGTVTDVQGGEITVHIDGERISRTIGFARKKGTMYAVGDRVKLSLLRNDEYVVDGIVGSDATDKSVYTDQIADWAIGEPQVKDFSLPQDKLDVTTYNKINNALTSIPAFSVGRNELKTNAVGPDELAGDSVDWGHLKGDFSKSGTLRGDLWKLVAFAKQKDWIPS